MNQVEIDIPRLVQTIVHAIYEKNGKQVVDVDLSPIENAVFGHFIICHGNTNTQVEAITDGIRDEVRKELDYRPYYVEGLENAHWVLMDYGEVVVHIFQDEHRGFYNLEALWADARVQEVKDPKMNEKE